MVLYRDIKLLKLSSIKKKSYFLLQYIIYLPTAFLSQLSLFVLFCLFYFTNGTRFLNNYSQTPHSSLRDSFMKNQSLRSEILAVKSFGSSIF